ncbi:MAG: transglycosylase SLT domain-containing protein [Rhodoferax sp.]|nr:transglycosylase SLT domain-containing protein [Rhodoferax sp.]
MIRYLAIATSLLAALTGCASNPQIPLAQPDASVATPEPSGTRQGPQTIQPADPTAPVKVRQADPDGKVTQRTVSAGAGNESTPLTALAETSSARSVASLPPPEDLWERIRRGYGMNNLDGALVRDREQWYATRPDYIYRMTERSKKYLFHIVEELEVRNMPTELALLPFIESAFNPQAVSSAKAAGMWQFMPATGKYFELKQNSFRDDRRDVLASTRAALDYLQKLYKMFGDWHLALAAYNWGEGNISRVVNKNTRAGLSAGYSDITMPMETRLYVPKLQAIKNIVSDPTKFNSQLPVIENHPYFQSVPIRRDIDVALAARLAQVSLEDFKALNPSQNRPVIIAAGTPQILLPWDNAEVFQSNLEGYSGRLATWTAWVVPSTMRPADVAKKVGMSEAELRTLNKIPPRVLVRAGSTLLVPRGAHAADVPVKVADNSQLALAPEVVLKRTTVKAARGDTVATIARRYKTTAANVAEWNRVSASAAFKAGQPVVIYRPQQSRKDSTQGKKATSQGTKRATGKNTSAESTKRTSRTDKPAALPANKR